MVSHSHSTDPQIRGFFDRQHSYLLLFLVVAVVMLFDPFVFFVAKMFRAKEAWVLPMNMEPLPGACVLCVDFQSKLYENRMQVYLEHV